MHRVNVYIDEDSYQFLKKSSGTMSENIRSAIQEYIRNIRKFDSSASQSKRRERENNG